MRWISQYQLFLFDFDGLLVNTEEFHFRAYHILCKNKGLSLNWDLHTYLKIAMFSDTGIRTELYKLFPSIKDIPWEILYQEKKEIYLDLIGKEAIELLPGVELLLTELDKNNIKRCVVTNSPREQINQIRTKKPLLNSIPHWITREDYTLAKPHPECYQKAIELYADQNDTVVGFEDSPRGLQALLLAGANGFFISPYFQKSDVQISKPFMHYATIASLVRDMDKK